MAQAPQRLILSPKAASLLDAAAPRELQLRAAKGEVPLDFRDQLTLLIFYLQKSDQDLRRLALQTLRSLPAAELQALLADSALHPRLVDIIGRVYCCKTLQFPSLLDHPALTSETVAFLAKQGSADVAAALLDHQRWGKESAVLAALSENDAAQPLLQSRQGNDADDDSTEEPELLEEDLEEGAESEADEEPAQWDDDEELNLSKYQMALEMPVAEKIKMALTGDKEWRTILIREANKLVSSAVLKNPRITDGEVLTVAKNRSTSDELIRIILANREWIKSLEMKKALVVHPRTPLPMALRFLNFLGEKDLKHLTKSREVRSVIVNAARRSLVAKEKKGG